VQRSATPWQAACSRCRQQNLNAPDQAGWSPASDTVTTVKGARLGGLLARGLIGGAAAIIVVVATLLTWPSSVLGPTADQQRISDLQRLAHAIDAYRLRQHVLPSSLARLPVEPAAPVRRHDPITNRPYDYRPLGPLAYELCALFDAAGLEEERGFWWHDGGRFCFALESRPDPKPPPAAPGPAPAAPAAQPDPAVPGPVPEGEPIPDSGAAPPPAPSAPPPDPPAGGGSVRGGEGRVADERDPPAVGRP
jgi:hypothetical protein